MEHYTLAEIDAEIADTRAQIAQRVRLSAESGYRAAYDTADLQEHVRYLLSQRARLVV